MLDTFQLRLRRFSSRSWLVAPLAASAVLLASPANAQECETDADCGFGFECYSDTLVSGTATSSSGSGGAWGTGGASSDGSSSDGVAGASSDGSSEPVCGDEFCTYGETWEGCPADCERYTYCAGAVCESDSDCAAGYVCELGGGSFGTTGGTGTSGGGGAFCGDGLCDAEEDAASCADDCQKTCTMYYQLCNEDEECPNGYYCDLSQGVSSVTVTSGSGGDVYEQWDGACMLNGTSGGSGGAGGSGGSGGGAGGNETDAGSSDTSNSSTTGLSTTATSGGGGTTSGTNGNAVSGSDGGHDHDHGHGPKNPWHDWRGCTLSGASAPGGSLPLALTFLLGSMVLRRRRNESSC